MDRHEKLKIDHEKQAAENFATWAAESLHGKMRTPTEYMFDADRNDLIAEDGSSAVAIFNDSYQHAYELCKEQPQLAFELRRRGEACELGELSDMLAMMRGELPDTMVVVSDFPPELMQYPKDVGGYNVGRKQTFLRVIFKDGSKLKMFSQTLDKSDRDGLEAIYHELGFMPKPGELLGQRMHFNSDDAQKQILTNRLQHVYDRKLEQKHGGRFEAGIRMPSNQIAINTYDFVHKQKDIIRYVVHSSAKEGLDENSQYELMAVLSRRYELARQKEHVSGKDDHKAITQAGVAIDQTLLEQEMIIYGREARLAGTTFSGCGSTLESAEMLSAEAQFDADGFGSKTSKEETYNFDAYRYCVSCQAPPKGKEKPKWCGPCGLCRGCDKKAGGKG